MLGTEFREERVNEKRDILAPLPQRRNMDAKEVQPIVKILPEGSPLHRSAEFNIRGGDNSDINVDVFLAAEAREFARLQHAQELHLRLRRHFTDFIEEQRAGVCLFKHAASAGNSIGKRAFFVPEELAL